MDPNPPKQDNSVSTPEATPDLRYVHLDTSVQIEFEPSPIPEENALKLTFLNEKSEVRTDLDPNFILCYLIDRKGKDHAVKFRNVHLKLEFSEQGFLKNKATLQTIDPTIEEWGKLEMSNQAFDMNPAGPPKT